MTARRAAIGILILLLLALFGVAGVMAWRGVTAPVLMGLFLGVGLGGLNLLFEALSLGWALRRAPSAMLGVSLGGFGLRLVLVAVLTLWFAKTESVDAVTFALTYVATFVGFLGLQVFVGARLGARSAGAAGGEEG